MPYPDIKPERTAFEIAFWHHAAPAIGAGIVGLVLGLWLLVRYVLGVQGLWSSVIVTVLTVVVIGCVTLYFKAEATENWLRGRKKGRP